MVVYPTVSEKIIIALKKGQFMKSKISVSLSLVSLLALSGCDWFGAKKPEGSATAASPESVKTDVPQQPKGEVLLSLNDKVLLTVPEFEEEMAQFLELQPQYKQMMAFMPDAEYQIFSNVKSERILDEWANKNKLAERADFKKELEKIVKLGRRQLAVKYFVEAHPISVPASDVRKFYDENKTMYPDLQVSKGGIQAKGVKFDTKDAAQAFKDKVAGGDLEKIAKDDKHTVKNFKGVSDKSFEIDEAVRTKLLEFKKFPSEVVVVAAKDKDKEVFWVIKAQSKEEPKYVPFDEIKDKIEEFLKEQKKGEMFMKELEKLQKELGITEHKDYFDRKKKEREAEQEKMKKEYEKKMQAKKGAQSADNQSKPESASKVAVSPAKPNQEKAAAQSQTKAA